MEETINTTAEATESGAEGFGGNEVNISDLLTDNPQGTVEAPGAENAQEPITRSDGAEPERPIQNQTDFNAALKTRLAEKEATVSRRYTSSPEYQLGKMLLAERMQKDGVSAEVAAQRIRQERIDQRAQQYKQDPQEFYRDYLQSQTQPAPAPQANPMQNAPQDEASTLAQQLYDAKQAGILPDSFDPNKHITREFISDVQRFGVEAAARIFQVQTASTDSIVSELERRRQQPQPIRPTGGSVSAPKIDIANMTDAEFAALDAKIGDAMAKGKRVKF